MMDSSLLPLVLLLAVSVTPQAAALRPLPLRPAVTECMGDTTYTSNSTYEANLHRLAAVLPAAVSASQSAYTYQAAGFWPNRVRAESLCRYKGSVYSSGTYDGRYSSCADCIAGAFRELTESACPYHKEAYFSDRNCTLQLSEVRLFGTVSMFGGYNLKQILASGLIFQVVGFAWLFFLLLQEWRGRRRGTAMLSTPLVAGDS